MAGVVTLTDPDASAKKADRGRLRPGAVVVAGGLVRRPGRAVPGGAPPGAVLAAGGRPGPAAARVRPQRRRQGDDAVPPGRRVRQGKGVTSCPTRSCTAG